MNGAPRLPSTTSKSSCAQQPRLSSGFLFRRLPGSYPQIHGRHGTCTIHTHTPPSTLFIPNNYSLRRTSTGRLNGTGRRWSGEPDAMRAPGLSLCLFLSGSVGGGTTSSTSACSREGEKKWIRQKARQGYSARMLQRCDASPAGRDPRLERATIS